MPDRWEVRTRALGLAALVGLAASSPAFGANEIGRLTSVGNGSVRRHFQYDALGRVISEQHVLDGRSYPLQTSYGYLGIARGPGRLLTGTTFPDGETVGYGYDRGWGLQALTAGSQAVLTSVKRNSRGEALDTVFGNGARTVREYDDFGTLRLSRIRTCFGTASRESCLASPSPVQSYRYAYDPTGNVTAVIDEVVGGSYSATYEYDSLNQLTSRTSVGSTVNYRYDDVGNLIGNEGRVQTFGGSGRGPHALETADGVTYTYDFNGNVVSTSAGLTLRWNAENMADRVSQGAIAYDKQFLGESLWKKVEGGAVTYYLPSLRIEGGKHRKFYGAFAERSSEDSLLRFYHPDHLGSSTVVTGPGEVVAHRSAFKPYGEDVDGGAGSFVPKLRFNFKEKESTGLYDFGARLYNPGTGRWMSPDSSLRDGPNRYAYVGNNPVGFIDPSGHDKKPKKQEVILVDPQPVVVNITENKWQPPDDPFLGHVWAITSSDGTMADPTQSLWSQIRNGQRRVSTADALTDPVMLEALVKEYNVFTLTVTLLLESEGVRTGGGGRRGGRGGAKRGLKGAGTGPQNKQTGTEFENYVEAKKLKGVDEQGQLGKQERLETPDVAGRKYVQPDFTIYSRDHYVAAYADAKTGNLIPFDAQAQGLVNWSTTTRSKTLIYYTPTGNTPIAPSLLRYAQQMGVKILQVMVP